MIVTHTNPDFDAICGVWLLKRFMPNFSDLPVEFVNTGNPDTDKLAAAKAVVDTGKEYNSTFNRFDHHHLPVQVANNTCAAMQVFYATKPYADIDYLKPLVDLIFAGDTGRNEANASRELGLHAILSGYKAWFSEQNPDTRLSDEAILAYGFGLLDVLEVRLRKQAKARAELQEKTIYKSDDGMVWAIRHGSQGSTFAAYEEGARVVVFEGKPTKVDGGTTYPVGIMRAGECTEPNVGELVERVAVSKPFADEIGKWFKHPAGFFAGRGTAKAPVFEPVEIDIAALAKAIDATWLRTDEQGKPPK